MTDSDDVVASKIVGDDSGGACVWCKKDTKKLSHCSGCRMTMYCSKECQKAAWPSHKAACKQARQSHNEFRAQGLGQIHRLFQEWFLQAGNSGMISLFVAICLRERLLHLPDDGIVLLIVDLNYNFQTFLPVDSPQILRAGDMDAQLVDTARMQREQTLQSRGQKAFYSLVIWLKQKTLICNVMPRTASREQMAAYPSASFEDASAMCLKCIKLSSKKLNAEVQKNLYLNLISQIEHLVHGDDSKESRWSGFLLNALRIPCQQKSQNRSKSHLILIEIKMGWAPGKIEGLECYDVRPWAEALESCPSSKRDELQACKEKVEKMTSRGGGGDDTVMQVPCVFTNSHRCGVSHIFWASIPAYKCENRNRLAPSECGELAFDFFEELKETFEFPEIAMPKLG